LFWEKRLQGLSASDVTEQIIKTMELPKGLQGVGPGSNDETLLSAVASALHTSSAPITGQVSAAVEKNPAVWLNTSQPLCKAFIVTDEDIRKQEERVQQVRKKLEEALMADILSRAADAEATGLEDAVCTSSRALLKDDLCTSRKQEERVQQVRKKLEEALMADILSRAADAEATGLEVDSGDDA
ncbi:hypothetical protein Celaphus_00017803, partial [Cervus elaphus hippelaphus]